MTAVKRAMVTVFGLGLLRPAPGTWGSLPPVILALALVAAGAGVWVINGTLILIVVIFSLVCVWLGTWSEQHFGLEDPRPVVADECAGQSLALLWLPWATGEGGMTVNLTLAATSFVAFRFFDVVKLPPAGTVQRLHGGWGILLDDLIAGVMALAVTHALAWLVW